MARGTDGERRLGEGGVVMHACSIFSVEAMRRWWLMEGAWGRVCTIFSNDVNGWLKQGGWSVEVLPLSEFRCLPSLFL